MLQNAGGTDRAIAKHRPGEELGTRYVSLVPSRPSAESFTYFTGQYLESWPANPPQELLHLHYFT